LTTKLEEVLELLKDEKWHKIEDVQKKLELDKEGFAKIFAFLKEYNFIIVDEEEGKIKLEESVRKFLIQTATS
jgi:DNA-binding IclR family transcriptional regulator